MSANGSVVVLDTNIAVLLLSGDRAIRQHVNDAEDVVVSTIVLGELYYGAALSSRVAENTQRVDSFASGFEVIEVTLETSRHYASIKRELHRSGTPVPDNDIWIAALAQQLDASVATRDKHFTSISGLQIASW